MNFTHLAAFQAVVETGSVTAAAQRLHVSQPALTREIRALEERLGVALFDRLPRGMSPTEAGRLLAGYGAQIFKLAEAAETAVEELAGLRRGHLALAASRTTGAYVLPAILDEFRRRHPDVSLALSVSNTDQVQAEVRSMEAQLGLIEGPHDTDTFEALPLGEDEIVAVAGATHPLARRRALTAAALGEAELVMREPGSGTREVVARAYASLGLTLSPRLSIGSPDAIKRLLRLGHAVSWVSRRSVEEELAAKVLVVLPVRDLRIVRELTMIWHRDRTPSPSALAFRALAQAIALG